MRVRRVNKGARDIRHVRELWTRPFVVVDSNLAWLARDVVGDSASEPFNSRVIFQFYQWSEYFGKGYPVYLLARDGSPTRLLAALNG
jgi:hypothetical protein